MQPVPFQCSKHITKKPETTQHTHSTSITKENTRNLQLKDLNKQLLPNVGILQAKLTRETALSSFQDYSPSGFEFKNAPETVQRT